MIRASVWRNPDFVRLWSAAVISTLGSHITMFALPFVAILVLDATPWQIAFLQIAQLLPALLIGFFAGAWVDRLLKRPVMIASDLVRAGALISIPLAAWTDRFSFAQLIIVAAITSVGNTFFDIADQSFLPIVVRSDELLDGNRLLTAGNTVSETIGFAAGGLLVKFLSAPGALVIDALSFLWSASWLWRIQSQEAAPVSASNREPIRKEISEGVRHIARSPMLRTLAVAQMTFSVGIGIIGTVYLLYLNREVGFSAGVLGLLFATGGLWSLVGSLITTRAVNLFGVGVVLMLGALLTGASQSLTAFAAAATTGAVIVILAQQSGDAAWSSYEIVQTSLRQSSVPASLQGRIHGSFRVLEVGASLSGALLGGWLGGAIGLRSSIFVGAGLVSCVAAIIAASPLRTLDEIPTSTEMFAVGIDQ